MPCYQMRNLSRAACAKRQVGTLGASSLACPSTCMRKPGSVCNTAIAVGGTARPLRPQVYWSRSNWMSRGDGELTGCGRSCWGAAHAGGL